MQNVKNFGTNSQQALTMLEAAEQFRNNIWTMVENWTLRMASEDSNRSWQNIPKAQIIDDMPALLNGVSKVIENPSNLVDFKPDGIIYQTAAKIGINRKLLDYQPNDLLLEQEILRSVIWSFCKSSLKNFDIFELESRINQALSKLLPTITESYIKAYSDELKYLSRHDKTTGFYNYDTFRELINDELKRSKRYRHSFSLLLINIDNYNELSNYRNQAEINELIREISSITTQVIRVVDIPFRYNTAEFAIILPETNKKQARRVAERIRRAIKSETRHEFQTNNGLKPLTVSIGIATYPRDAEYIEELISIADEMLSEARKSGDIVIFK